MYNQIGNRHLRQSSMHFGCANVAAPAHDRPANYDSGPAGERRKLESFDTGPAGFNSATGGPPSVAGFNDHSGGLSRQPHSHHSSTQCVRTQSQEYLRAFRQDDRSLQQNSAFVAGKQVPQHERAALSIGAAMASTEGGMLGIYKAQTAHGPTNLFDELHRKAKLTSSRPQQIQLTNQRHAHVQRLLAQQSDQVNLMQYSTPQQSKNPFIPSPSKLMQKGGTQMEQTRKLGPQPSRTGIAAEQPRLQPGQAKQRTVASGSKHGGGSSALIQYPNQEADALQVADEQALAQFSSHGPGGYGVVDQSTIYTSNNQNRQVRVISKKQIKSIHYSYQPVMSQQIIHPNPTATLSVAQQQQQQAQSLKQALAIGLPQRQSAKEKHNPEQQMEVLRQLAGGPQVLQAQPPADCALEEARRVQTKQRAAGQPQRAPVKVIDALSPSILKAQAYQGGHRQFSPTGRGSTITQISSGSPPSLASSGLDYLANIASIAQSSPQYVLDKNVIKAEIVNQAALAARHAGQPLPFSGNQANPEADQRLNQLVFENLMLGSHLHLNQSLPQHAIQNAHQRYDQQEKLIKAFRHVVASGNVDQLSGLEMLKRWQALYGQVQHEGGNPRSRHPPRFDPQKSVAAPQRINSTDCAGLPLGVSHTETLMQNIKISQLNQISAVLDQQTAKLIAHTQKLMKNNYPLESGPASDLSKVQQEAAVSLQQYRPGARYRSSYSGIHHKHYDRQRMLDFYSSIRLGDLDDQAKLRSQAIRQAPPLDPNKLRYSVVPGNNSRLIKIAMARRKDFWLETTSNDPHFHFKWQSWSGGMKFDIVGKDIAPEVHPCQKQIVNHFEGHGCVSEKSKLFLNLSHYASNKLNENVFDFLPLTFFVECDLSKQKQYSKSMVQFMNAFYALDDIKKRTKKFYQKLDSEGGSQAAANEGPAERAQPAGGDNAEPGLAGNVKEQLFDDNFIFKHFYQNKILLIRQHKKEEREEKEAYMEAMGANALLQGPTRSIKRFDAGPAAQNSTKLSISSNLKVHPELQNHESCENIHISDHKSSNANVNHALQKQTQNKILKKYFHRQSMPFCHYSGHNLWILKATKLNQGQGIHVCNSLPQIKNLIQRYCEGFPKKHSENFTYERDIMSNKKQANLEEGLGSAGKSPGDQVDHRSGQRSKAGAVTAKGKAPALAVRAGDRVRLSKSKNKSHMVADAGIPELDEEDRKTGVSPLRLDEDDAEDLERDIEKKDEDFADAPEEQESPDIAGRSGKKKHFANSKLSYSVPASKHQTASTNKIAASNTGTHASLKSNSVSRNKHKDQPIDIDEDDAEGNDSDNPDFDKSLTKDADNSQTPRAASGAGKRGMLSPKQNQQGLGVIDLDHAKNRDKQRHLNSTMPEGIHGSSGPTKPVSQFEAKYKHNSFIIQKYIERPLLIDRRKFDIRVWVFLDSKGSAFICKPGYLRTSSYKFELDPDDPDNRFVHLTNIAVQKYSEDFGAHEDGNILNFEQFEEYVHKTWPGRSFSLEKDLVFKIRQQIARTLFATRKLMDYNKRTCQTANNSNFFEIFGYDFMVDEDFNVWLIECNTNPALGETARYLELLIPRMIEDMIKLTIDEEYMYYYKQIIQVNKQLIAQTEDLSELPNDLADQSHLDNLLALKSPHLPGWSDDENVWEKLLNLHTRQQRKEAKLKYNVPIDINSKYAFNIKNRDFKIKKYINYRSQLEQVMQQAQNITGQGLKNHASSQSVNRPGQGLQQNSTMQPILEQNQSEFQVT